MVKFASIARNTFVQTIRQPIYGVLTFLTIFILVVVCLPMSTYTMGYGQAQYSESDQEFLLQLGLSVLLTTGALLAAFCASSALSREIEDKTALTVISKPVARSTYVLGKFAGVTAAITMAYYVCALVFLLVVRHKVTSAAGDPIDEPVIVLGLLALALALLIATAGNIFFNWTFISASITALAITLSIAMGIVTFVGKGWKIVPPGYDRQPAVLPNKIKVQVKPGHSLADFRAQVVNRGLRVDTADSQLNLATVSFGPGVAQTELAKEIRTWPGVEDATIYRDNPVITAQTLMSILLMFLAVLVLVAVSLAASTRFGQILTLLTCIGVAMAGIYHAQLLHHWADKVVLVKLAGPLLPKMTYFFTLDAIAMHKAVPAWYVGLAALYSGLYVAGALAIAVVLFQRRSLEADSGSASMPGPVNLLAGLGRIAAIILGLIGIEGYLSCLVGRFDQSFSPAVFLALASIAGKTSLAHGLLLSGGLILLGAAAYALWTYFGRAKRWAFYVTAALSILALATSLTGIIKPSLIDLGERSGGLVTGAIIAGVVMLTLILPSTRRHFHKA